MKKSGVLLPITSLPSDGGIGCFSKSAYDFVDFLKESGQSYWQILPLGHTGYGDSPYQSFSAFAGNPYMISLDDLADEGLISKEECNVLSCKNDGYVDYSLQFNHRYTLLYKAFEQWNSSNEEEYKNFVSENEFWLEDYSLFMALKYHFGNMSSLHWEEGIRRRKPEALEKYRITLSKETDFWKFVQFKFFSQWDKLKKYANGLGIEIMGDMPIYVSGDSSDVWANPHLFRLDENLIPTHVAGCPPDGFSEDGQLWGNPLYNWEVHKKDDYSWWIMRIKYSFRLFDCLRIDHFRGFEKYYSIPFGAKNARSGKWEQGPKEELFLAVERKLGRKNIVAEDLGFITEEVKELLRKCGFAGIKVLEFAFDERDTGISSDYLPHNYPENCVAYTGTHDNEPIQSWFESMGKDTRHNIRKYVWNFHSPDKEIYKSLLCSVLRSPAKTVILPLWDILGLGSEARINTPGTDSGNWTWRVKKEMLTKDAAEFLKEITALYDRCPK